MKMDKATFEALRRDFWPAVEAWQSAKGPFAVTMRHAWDVFFRIDQERGYDASMRGQLEAATGVPCSVDHVQGHRMGALYDSLNDSHIETALRRILNGESWS